MCESEKQLWNKYATWRICAWHWPKMQIKFLCIYLGPEVPFHRSSNLIFGAIFNSLEYLDEMWEASFKNIRHIWYRSPDPNEHLQENLILLGVGGYFYSKKHSQNRRGLSAYDESHNGFKLGLASEMRIITLCCRNILFRQSFSIATDL